MPLDRTKLIDVDEAYRQGHMPYTFLGWRSELSDADGLPTDGEALEFLALLQERGVRFGAWQRPERSYANAAVLSFGECQQIIAIIDDLEREGLITEGLVAQLTERLSPP